MKVVLFCGGQGMRIREYSERIPKPLVPIGYRPILWHVMRWYAYHGHRDFVLCLGYRGDVIKRFFLDYEEEMSNDFVLSEGGTKVELLNHDTADWRIAFVETGLQSSPGERLLAVRKHLQDDELFLVNYADNVTDVAMDAIIQRAERTGAVATLLSVRPSATFHTIQEDDGYVTGIGSAQEGDLRINGGFFVCRQEIFEYLNPGEDLVTDAFPRLIKEGKLAAYHHDGFWVSMDTFKEREVLNDLYVSGRAPWELWKRDEG